MRKKFIFVTGGVVSALGKGVATASIGLLLQKSGFKVAPLKFDPYLNVDPGTMNPFQHGEVFVTEDGAETDLDLGHYERFLNIDLKRENNVTAGQIYHRIIEKERRGDYLGGTVQVVPHLTDEIKGAIKRLAVDDVDVVLTEIGGTVGDIESLPFLEAIRQMRLEEGMGNTFFIHVTLVPYIKTAGELKTKPTQHSVQKLREIGIQPDLLLCRTDRRLEKEQRSKIALFANLPIERVIEAIDVETVYEIPLLFHENRMDGIILDHLGLKGKKPDLTWLKEIVDRIKNPQDEVTVALVGKYVHLRDSYKSVLEALTHAGAANRVKVNLKLVDSEEIEKRGPEELLRGSDGILVPGGFGHRGIEGKIKAIGYARENKIPYLGLCLGMQLATVEFARNVAGLKGANSTEFDPNTPYPVITILPEKRDLKRMGGTLRLGAYKAVLKNGTLAFSLYKQKEIMERHRHRYEFNPKFRGILEDKGLVVSGESPDGVLVEIIELRNHPFFIAVQFHPEFKSRPMSPHPLFVEFIKRSKEKAEWIA